mmetsp:Transcript_13368/g.22753  ORF Transcript_13368/g.22753 Transcript_13368/m.22753 type:complete len:410 (-) Transcript_13368:53-1282(-)
MACESPLKDSDTLKDKYFRLIDTNFESIFESITAVDALKSIPEKHQAKFKEILNLITGELKGDKEELKKHIRERVQPLAVQKYQNRVNYESRIKALAQQSPCSHAELKGEFTKYIQLEQESKEVKRAQYLYERALSSSLDFENDIQFWMKYIKFIQEHLNDVSLARAKFEQKQQNSKLMQSRCKVEVMIQSAVFEENQNNANRAKKIYEQLDQDIAPGLLKSRMARINFEKRQGNNEKVRELFFESFSNAIEKEDRLAVTYIAVQYSRFVAKYCNDSTRAIEIFKQAIQSKKCANKVLYLSYVNTIRSLNVQNQVELIRGVYDTALDHLLLLQHSNPVEFQELRDIAAYYLAFAEEEARDAQQLKEVNNLRQRLSERGLLVESEDHLSNLINMEDQRQVGKKRMHAELA